VVFIFLIRVDNKIFGAQIHNLSKTGFYPSSASVSPLRFLLTLRNLFFSFFFWECKLVPCFVTPHWIWLQHDLRLKFAYFEGKKGKAIEEAEGLHFGLLSSRDASSLIGVLG
jgi:hypothetical protein